MKNNIGYFNSNRRLFIILVDMLLISCAWLVAFLLRLNLNGLSMPNVQMIVFYAPLVVLGQVLINYWFGIHRGSWRFCSMNDLTRIIQAASAGVFLTVMILFLKLHTAIIPRSIPFIYGLLLVVFLGGARLLYRKKCEYSLDAPIQQRVLVIGAGAAGESLVRDLLRNKHGGYKPVAFIDDSPLLHHREIHGIRVYGQSAKLASAIKRLNIELIIIAMPSISSKEMQRIVGLCEKTGLPFRTVPSIKDLTSGRLTLDALRNVSLEDLLGREQVNLDWADIANTIQDKVVLVTGGAGSIGSELCRQIIRLSPRKLVIVDNNEFNLYTIDMALQEQKGLSYLPVLLDVTDREGIRQLMLTERPQIVFHAAAYKHVPMLEQQIRCAIKNNVIGTQVLAEEAVASGVGHFIMVSTDKAVRPTNIMGSTKRMAEIFCQNMNKQSQTEFMTVRFGNVLGSAGSVVPLFKQQLRKGGPITVTHPDVTRYFMTIEEAAQLILQATTLGHGGEIFVLDMGQPIKIQYLAEQIIQLAGLQVGTDIEIVYTGLREGEKLHEELFHETEALLPTPHQKISLARSLDVDWLALQETMGHIKQACDAFDTATLLRIIHTLVPEYTPSK